jgi:hypothetical protein
MKRLLTVFAFSMLCLIINARAAEQPVDFSGKWILDVKASDSFPHPINNLDSLTHVQEGSMGRGMPGGGGGMEGGMPGGGGGRMGGGMPGGGFPGGGMGRGAQGPGGNIPPMVIEQKESELRIITMIKAMGKDMPLLEKYICDGAEHAEMVPVQGSPSPVKMVTKATWKKKKLQVRTVIHFPNNRSETKKEYSLSEDGKTLTVKTSTTILAGEMIQNQIYHKE